MNNILLIALSIFSVLRFYSQEEGTVVFNKVLHDFQLIEEERGIVLTEFLFTNTSREPYKVINTKSSCSCATMGVSKEFFKQGDTLSLVVAYDPTGLPGKFNKSIEITFRNKKGKEIKRHLSIKGVTVSLLAKSFLNKKDNKQKETNVIYYHKQNDVNKTIETKSKSYKDFISNATKVSLMHKNVKLLITIYHPEPDYAFEKLLRHTYESINKDLTEQGIPEQSIIFLDPKVELSSKDKYMQVSIINESNYTSPSLNEDILAEFLITINGEEQKVPINKTQQMSLPIYFQYFRNKLRDIDTLNPIFKEYLKELAEHIRGKEDMIEFKIISNASKWVYSTDKFDNNYIANLRGRKSLNTLISYLEKEGVKAKNISSSMSVNVIGPEMNKRNYVPFFYRKFQYIKIIPVYKVKAKEDIGIKGFVYYYKQSAEALNYKQKQFYAFVDKLSYLIQTEGTAKVRLEGSSSKSGNSILDTKKKLAYTRIEDLKDNLERELYKRGINPQRMIVIEENALVGGPEKIQGTEKEFIKHQYAKAIIVR